MNVTLDETTDFAVTALLELGSPRSHLIVEEVNNTCCDGCMVHEWPRFVHARELSLRVRTNDRYPHQSLDEKLLRKNGWSENNGREGFR